MSNITKYRRDITTAVNKPEILQAQAIAAKTDATIVASQHDYDTKAAIIKQLNAAITQLSNDRMAITRNIDALKKDIMATEALATDFLNTWIKDAKAAMLAFHKAEQEKQQKAIEATLSPTAEVKAPTMAEQMDMISARLTGGMAAKTKNIRTIQKARMDGRPIEWVKLMSLLCMSGVVDAEALVEQLPRAIKKLGLEQAPQVGGVEYYSEQVQIG